MSATRRALLGGLLTAVAGRALAEAPAVSLLPVPRPGRRTADLREAPAAARVSAPPADDLIAEADLGGEVTYLVADAKTGLVLEARKGGLPMPPASTAKAITSLYALSHLGRGFRFPTRLVAFGAVTDGVLGGDLVLAGGGDPTLSTDHLGDMASRLHARGVRAIAGRFLVWGGALPYVAEIDPAQPDWFGYNPSVSGINLNFNRVNFVWKRGADGYILAMDARGDRFVLPVSAARITAVERAGPLYRYESGSPAEEWSVAAGVLNREGSRWLPVRHPEAYAGDVFRTLARNQGVDLPDPEVTGDPPDGGAVLVEQTSDDLPAVLRDMMKYSTNLTAEAVGMAASLRVGSRSHAGSGRAMSDWLKARTGAREARFVDHSGLGPRSRIPASEMVGALVKLGAGAGLRGLMKEVSFRDKADRLPDAIRVEAKTGTLNFVSTLAGYMTAPNGADLAFAIFTGDAARRDGLPADEQERPAGGSAWVKRSKRLQSRLIRRWAEAYGG